MFSIPYQTTPLKDHDVAKIKNKLEQAYLLNKNALTPLSLPDEEYGDRVLALISSEEDKTVGLFSNPVLINIDPASNKPDNNRFVVDCRGYTARQKTGEVKVTKPAIYKIAMRAGILTDAWYHQGVERFTSISKLPTKVFSNWLATAISRKLNIDEIAQVRVNIIIAYYFLCMFEDLPEYDTRTFLDDDKAYIYALKISYASGVKNMDVIRIIKEIPTMSNIFDLEKALKEFGGSERLRLFNPAFLYTLVSRTALFGVSPEMVYCSLEYPPIFYMMMYIAIKEKGYNKSNIGSIVHNLRNTEEVKHFVRMVEVISE